MLGKCSAIEVQVQPLVYGHFDHKLPLILRRIRQNSLIFVCLFVFETRAYYVDQTGLTEVYLLLPPEY